MMSYLSDLFVALLMIVLTGFLAISALRRLIRNMHLTRKGSITTGQYLSSTRVVFFLDAKKRIEFVTWRNSFTGSKKLEVLYNPERPEQAEVRVVLQKNFKPIKTKRRTAATEAFLGKRGTAFARFT